MTDRLSALKKRRTNLEAALYSGAQSIRHGDKQVNNRSVDEIKKALSDLDQEIDIESGKSRSKTYYINAKRGY